MFATATSSFTRPANTTAYAANDLVANDTTAGNVIPLEWTIPIGDGKGVEIQSWHITKSGTTITNADFDVYVYASLPTPSVGDNGAFVASNVIASNNSDDFIGILQGSQMLGFSDGGSIVEHTGAANLIRHRISGNKLYGLLVAQAAYTPASGEEFTVKIEFQTY